MTTKHTPAPWGARYIRLCNRDSPDMSGIPYRHSYEFRVDFFSKVDIDFEEGKANAKLIALSPKMYDFIARFVNAGSSIDLLEMVEEGAKLLEELK